MIIKELYIKAFGRLSNTRILLGDNLNIIYGPNEKGKSTIHKFIEAMLFGFVKPGLKKRSMMDEYYLYRPWTGDLYEGSLVYEVEGGLYKVERNLAKGRESVRVLDNITGEDVTGRFGYHRARKEPLFASRHLGISHMVFRNTISISQLGSKSDKALAREIQTRLGNLGSAGDADISVGRAEKIIKEYLDEIGTDRARTKEYGRLCRQVEELENGIKTAAAAVEDLRSLGRQLKEAEAKAGKLRAVARRLEERIKSCSDSQALRRWADIKGIREEKAGLTASLEEYAEYQDFDPGDSEELYSLVRVAEQDRQEITRIRAKIEETALDTAAADGEVFVPGRQGRDEREEAVRRSIRSGFVTCALLTAAAAAAAVLAVVRGSAALGILPIPLIILILYHIRRTVIQKGRLRELEEAARKLELERRYMEKYKDQLQQSLSERQKELDKREERISEILEQAGAHSAADYRDRAAGHKRYAELSNRLQQTERLLDTRLDGEDFAAVQKRAEEIQKYAAAARIDEEYRDETDAEELSDWKLRLEGISEEEADILRSMEKIKGSIETLQKSLKSLPDMEEELSMARERQHILEKERKAAQIALEVLQEASAEVHSGFAPVLNKKVGDIIAEITGGRYKDLRINKDLEILATSPETGRQVKAERLSGGTVDQFYFALRVAASELLSDRNKPPLFLDDSFVQYDMKRLAKVMEYIIFKSRTRQIILFTCQNREKEVADGLEEEYNYLEIE